MGTTSGPSPPTLFDRLAPPIVPPTPVNPRKPKNRFLVVDGRDVTVEEESQLDLAGGWLKRAQGPAVVVSLSLKWRRGLDTLERDEVLQGVLAEYAAAFDAEFALDAGIAETLGEVSREEGVTELARTVIRGGITEDLLCYLATAYRRVFLWFALLGGAPHAYLRVRDVEEGGGWPASPPRLFSRQQARQETLLADRAFGRLPRLSDGGPGAPETALLELGEGLVRTGSEIRRRLKALSAPTRAPLAVASLRVLKLMRHGLVPYVPDPLECQLFYQHRGRGWSARCHGRTFEEFRWEERPRGRPLEVDFCSTVTEGAEQSEAFGRLSRAYHEAVLMNSRRSITVAPDDQGGEARDKQQDALTGYFSVLSERYPHQVYDDMVRKSGDRMGARLLATPSLAAMIPDEMRGMGEGGTPAHLRCGGLPSGGSAADMLEGYEDHVKRRVLSQLNVSMENDRLSARSYRHLRDFLTARSEGTALDAARAYDRLTPNDQAMVESMLWEAGDRRRPVRPEVHRLESGSRLINAYTASVGVVDLEELYNLWSVMWRSQLGNSPLYGRRRNNLEYRGVEGRRVPDTSLGARRHFCAMFNYDLKLLKNYRTRHLQVNDIFILSRVLDRTPAFQSVAAQSLSLLTSEVALTPQLPPDQQGFATVPGLSNEAQGRPAPPPSLTGRKRPGATAS